MDVRVMILATGAYACIRDGARTLDIRLMPGRSAPKALREHVASERKRASDILERADLAERAATQLEA